MRSAGGGVPGQVVIVGSVNVDLVMRLPRLPAAGQTVLGGVFARHHGGKGANQAVAAARAGAQVHLVGAVGVQDGQESTDALRAEGIDVTHVVRLDGFTGHAVVLVDQASGENQIAVAPGANALLQANRVGAALTALRLGPEDVVVLSFELPAAPLREASNLAARARARLVVNPAPAQDGYADLLTGAIVTPNMHELADLAAQARLPAGTDPRATAAALARRTGGPVIVTMGADGALLTDGGASEYLPGHRVRAVDTTGAGDTLTGVLAAGLAQGYDLRGSLRRAMAAASLAVTAAGARAGMPTRGAIDDMVSGG